MKTGHFFITAMLLMLVACGIKTPPKPPLGGTPAEVKNFEALPRENAIMLTWKIQKPPPESKFTEAAAFEIQRRVKPRGNTPWSDDFQDFANIKISGEADRYQWLDTKIESGMEYQYQVAAVDAQRNTGPYSKIVETTWEPPPQAPVGLTAEPGDRSVMLKWTQPTEGEKVDGYYIYRAESGKDFQLVLELSIPRTDFIDVGVTNGVTYRYEVRAARLASTVMIEGPASQVVETIPSDRMAPQVPIGVEAFITPGGVMIKWWPNNEEDLAGYNVYRTSGKETVKLTAAPVKQTEYVDVSASRGHSYSYNVTAVDNANNESAHSESAQIFVK